MEIANANRGDIMKTRGMRPNLPPIGFLIDLEDGARARLAEVGHFISRPLDALLSVQGPHSKHILKSGMTPNVD